MLKVGFSRLDVTPPIGADLWGYFHKRVAKGIIDPIEISALALSDGNETALIIIADFESIQMKYALKLKKLISAKTGINPVNIFIHTTHAHTSIGLTDPGIIPYDNSLLEDYDYLGFLYRKFCDISVMAIEDMSEAVWCYAEGDSIEQYTYVRRYIMKNGLVRTNPFGVEADIVKPSEESDNTVRLVRFRREGKRDIAFVNYQVHADSVGKEYFSADWPGFARRKVEKVLKDVYCAVMVGFQGDTGTMNFMAPPQSTDTPRYILVGNAIADTVVSLWDKAEECEGDTIYCAEDMVYNKTNTDKEEYYEECKKYVTDLDEKGQPKAPKSPSGISYVEALRIVNIKELEPMYKKVPLSVFSMGKFSIVGIGGEPFVNYIKAVHNAFPDKKIFTACLMNGYEGYLPTKSAYEDGGYESGSAAYSPSLEEEVRVEVVDML
ncbi:MAG: hypothetical protein IIV81_03235, partial [Clostridia bacterium]|nr:hypothetical protein [Clostridia bacterium]